MKNLFLLQLLICFPVFSQVNDSLPASKKADASIKDKFPTTRNFDIQYEYLGASDFKSELHDKAFEKGKVENHSRFRFASNIVLFTSKSQRFLLTNSLRYKYEAYDFGTVSNALSATSYQRPRQEFHYFAEALSGTYFGSLFKKTAIFNASAILDADHKAFQRVTGMVSAILVMKKTESTTMTLGAAVFIDASSPFPASPIFTYEHKFRNSYWTLDVILPQRVMLKHGLLENGRISLGTEMGSETYYIHAPEGYLKKGVYQLTQLELKSGFTYEYSFFKDFVASVKGGVVNTLQSRITERGKSNNKYAISSKQDAQFYFNIGLSYNPF